MDSKCGNCQSWQVIDSSQLADGTDRNGIVGRCRSPLIASWASARRRDSQPYLAHCFAANSAEVQGYAEHARTIAAPEPVALRQLLQVADRMSQELASIADDSEGWAPATAGEIKTLLLDFSAAQTAYFQAEKTSTDPATEMALDIAYHAARSDIECFCEPWPKMMPASASWWHTGHEDDTEAYLITRAVEYLELQGLLERHPEAAHLVRILERPDLQEQSTPHPLSGLHINKGSMDAAAEAYEAEYKAKHDKQLRGQQ